MIGGVFLMLIGILVCVLGGLFIYLSDLLVESNGKYTKVYYILLGIAFICVGLTGVLTGGNVIYVLGWLCRLYWVV